MEPPVDEGFERLKDASLSIVLYVAQLQYRVSRLEGKNHDDSRQQAMNAAMLFTASLEGVAVEELPEDPARTVELAVDRVLAPIRTEIS